MFVLMIVRNCENYKVFYKEHYESCIFWSWKNNKNRCILFVKNYLCLVHSHTMWVHLALSTNDIFSRLGITSIFERLIKLYAMLWWKLRSFVDIFPGGLTSYFPFVGAEQIRLGRFKCISEVIRCFFRKKWRSWS